MAQRRMFSKNIIDSDAFLELPQSSQLLYFHLSMRADDDGFINQPKAIMRVVGCKDDDMNILIHRKFVINFESGVVVIKHWKIHNYIQADRYVETKYKDEKKALLLDKNNSYTLNENDMYTKCIQNGYNMDTQVRLELGKVRLGKDSSISDVTPSPQPPQAKRNQFVKPTIDEIKEYCVQRRNSINPEHFYDYYESKGWTVGKTKMKDWKATIRNWERSENRFSNSKIVISEPEYHVAVVSNSQQEEKAEIVAEINALLNQ